MFLDIREQIIVKERSGSTVGGVWVRRKPKKKLSIRTYFWTVKSIKKSFKAFEIRPNFYKITVSHFSLFALGIMLTKAYQTKRHSFFILSASRVAIALLTCLLSFLFSRTHHNNFPEKNIPWMFGSNG